MTQDAPPPSDSTSQAARRVLAVADFMWTRLSLSLFIWLVPAVTLWPLMHPEELPYLALNNLDMAGRKALVRATVASVVLMAGLYGGLSVHWSRTRRWTAAESFGFLNRRLYPGLALVAVPVLRVPRVEATSPILTWAALLALSVGLFLWLRRLTAWIGDERLRRWGARSERLALALTLLVGALYAWRMSALALQHFTNMRSQIYDLGIYDNLLWNTTFGEFLRCTFIKGGNHAAAHFDPILYLLTPIYRLAPRPQTLLSIQAFWLATGVVPLYLIGRRLGGSGWIGALLATLYALYPPLHGANLFDFHSITLVVPFLLWGLWLLDDGAPWPFWLVFALTLATREDMSLLSCFVGFYVIVTLRRPWLGLSIIGVSIAYLAFVKLTIMPDPGLLMKPTRDTYSYIYFYKDMIPHTSEGAKGLVVSFFTNPAFVLEHMLSAKKVFHLLALLVPLMGLPLLARRRYPLFLYGLLFLFLSSRKHMYSIHFQYNAVILPYLLVGVMDGLEVAGRRWGGARPVALKVALALGCLVNTGLVGAKFGILRPNASFRAGWEPLLRKPPKGVDERYAWFFHKVRKLIPPDASVSASSRLGPHVSGRAEVYRFPVIRDADYVMVMGKDMGKREKRALKRLKKRGRYRRIAAKHGIQIFQRVAPPRPKPKPKAGAGSKSPKPTAKLAPGASLRPTIPKAGPVRSHGSSPAGAPPGDPK